MKNRSIIVATKGQSTIESEVHLNLWKLSKTNFALDIGIKLFQYFGSQVTELFIYLPYKLTDNDIVDLGQYLQTDDIVSTIFNDDYVGEAGPQNSSIRKFKIRSKEQYEFNLFTLGSDEIKIHDVSKMDGSFITLTLPNSGLLGITQNDNLYVRLRVNLPSNMVCYIKHDEAISNDVFQSAFSKNELYDIRLNSMRDIDPKVFQKITTVFDAHLVKLKKCHFFFITTVRDKISNGNLNRMDSRMLESDKWAEYIPENGKHVYMAYHWKKKNENNVTFESFEVFFRTVCDNKNILKIISYLLMAIAIGSLGSLISTIGSGSDFAWMAVVTTLSIGIVGFLLSRL